MTDWDYDKFKNTFPILFREDCYFECDIGWKDIIWNLCEQLEPLCEMKESNGEGAVPYVDEVKEKYGILRFYLTHANEEMNEFIIDAERLSAVTCEVCGCPGKVRGRSCVKTLCESCL